MSHLKNVSYHKIARVNYAPYFICNKKLCSPASLLGNAKQLLAKSQTRTTLGEQMFVFSKDM